MDGKLIRTRNAKFFLSIFFIRVHPAFIFRLCHAPTRQAFRRGKLYSSTLRSIATEDGSVVKSPQMKAVILAAGKGTRMRELTNELPKPMLCHQGKPILEHIVEGIVAAGIRDISSSPAGMRKSLKTISATARNGTRTSRLAGRSFRTARARRRKWPKISLVIHRFS